MAQKFYNRSAVIESKTCLAPTKTLSDPGGDYEPECREASLSDAGGVHAGLPDSDCVLSGANG